MKVCYLRKNFTVFLLLLLVGMKVYSCEFFLDFCFLDISGRRDDSSEEQEKILCQISNCNDSNAPCSESYLEEIVPEIFVEIYDRIGSHKTAVDFSRVSKKFRRYSIKYWENFISKNKLEKWDERVPAVKVAYAHKVFLEKKYKLAAKLGLPQAVAIIRKKEAENYYPPIYHASGFGNGWF